MPKPLRVRIDTGENAMHMFYYSSTNEEFAQRNYDTLSRESNIWEYSYADENQWYLDGILYDWRLL